MIADSAYGQHHWVAAIFRTVNGGLLDRARHAPHDQVRGAHVLRCSRSCAPMLRYTVLRAHVGSEEPVATCRASLLDDLRRSAPGIEEASSRAGRRCLLTQC